MSGAPTVDKRTVSLSVPDPNYINSFLNFRVADIQACYELWKSRGAEFITAQSTARSAATSAILTDILSRSDRAPTRRTVDARPGKSILIVPSELLITPQLYRGQHFLVRYRQKGLRFCDLVRDVNERIIA
jgi:hypothetical protein